MRVATSTRPAWVDDFIDARQLKGSSQPQASRERSHDDPLLLEPHGCERIPVVCVDLDVVALAAFDRQRESEIADQPRAVRAGGEHDLPGPNDALRRPELGHARSPATDLEDLDSRVDAGPSSLACSAIALTNSCG